MISASPLDAAEQTVLGAMLLSKQSITDVAKILSSDDLYRPAHQAIFDCILFLHRRDQPADPVTVTTELQDRDDLVMVGGAPYLHSLIAVVPTALNVGYYAEIVAANAVLRRGQSG